MFEKMNIIVPLAGKDKNFEERGMIKPLTKVNGKEIIKWIAESRPYSYKNAIFIVLREHQEQYKIGDKLKEFFGNEIKIIILDGMTEGSPQSILKAKQYIDNDLELIIDLGDQYLDLDGFEEFLRDNKDKCEGVIPSFESYFFNRGYMIIKNNKIRRVSEKDPVPISSHSTACISYFKKGSDFVKYAEQMVEKKRTAANGVYLPSLVYNEMIEDNKTILHCKCELVAPLGTVQGADCFPQINRPLKLRLKKLILHRGYKFTYLENSKTSFENALREGFDFETDIRVSKDGKCYMIHDEDLGRLFNGFGKIKDKKSIDLVKYSYEDDENEKLCSLDELCELVKNSEEDGNKESKIFIHIKEVEDIDKVVSVLDNYNFQNRVVFFACDEITKELINIIKEKYPKYKVGLHYYENNDFVKEDFNRADFIWADEITKKNITEEIVEQFHKFGKPIYVISPELIPESIFNEDVEKRWGEFLDLEVDGVCTDKPEDFLKFIGN